MERACRRELVDEDFRACCPEDLGRRGGEWCARAPELHEIEPVVHPEWVQGAREQRHARRPVLVPPAAGQLLGASAGAIVGAADANTRARFEEPLADDVSAREDREAAEDLRADRGCAKVAVVPRDQPPRRHGCHWLGAGWALMTVSGTVGRSPCGCRRRRVGSRSRLAALAAGVATAARRLARPIRDVTTSAWVCRTARAAAAAAAARRRTTLTYRVSYCTV